jgi:hypothetical protein
LQLFLQHVSTESNKTKKKKLFDGSSRAKIGHALSKIEGWKYCKHEKGQILGQSGNVPKWLRYGLHQHWIF